MRFTEIFNKVGTYRQVGSNSGLGYRIKGKNRILYGVLYDTETMKVIPDSEGRLDVNKSMICVSVVLSSKLTSVLENF